MCSRLLWAFDLKDAVTGRAILLDIDDEEQAWTDGVLSQPKSFPVMFVPRSNAKADALKARYVEIQAQWEAMGYPKDSR